MVSVPLPAIEKLEHEKSDDPKPIPVNPALHPASPSNTWPEFVKISSFSDGADVPIPTLPNITTRSAGLEIPSYVPDVLPKTIVSLVKTADRAPIAVA